MRAKWLALAVCCACALPLLAQERRVLTTAADFQIRGVLVSASNRQPLSQARITITSATDSKFNRMVNTGVDGRFAVDHLKPGKYALSAEGRGFRPQGYQQHEGRFSTAIAVGPDLPPPELIFRISPDASLSGRIVDDHGESVRNARVMLVAEDLREGVRSRRMVGNNGADDQGYYHFAHLPAGAYYVSVMATPWYTQAARPAGMNMYDFGDGNAVAVGAETGTALDVAYPLTFYPDVTDAAAASPITLQPGDRASADIKLRAVPALHVRIINVGGESGQFFVATLAQRIFDDVEVPVPASTNRATEKTAVLTGVAPGHYLLRLNTRRRGPRSPAPMQDAKADPEPMRVRELDLAGDTEIDAGEGAAAAIVTGAVRLDSGQPPVRPVAVQLRNRAGQSLLARTSATGEFIFPDGAPAGAYDVVMSSGEGMFIRSITAIGARQSGRLLQIGASDAVRLSILAGAGLARVDGLAIRDGKPQSGAMVLLVPRDPANHLPLFRRDQSDSDGTFSLSSVLPGRYTLVALENGWDLEWSNPALLKPYLAAGTPVVVEANGRYNLRVESK